MSGAREQEAKQRRVMAEEERRRKIEGKHMADATKIEAKAQMLAAEQARLAKEAAEWKARVERQVAEDKAYVDALDHKIKDGDVKAKEKKEAERKMTMLEHARAEGAWLYAALYAAICLLTCLSRHCAAPLSLSLPRMHLEQRRANCHPP